MKINLKPNKILIQEPPVKPGTWNIAKVVQVSDYVTNIKPGDIIVYDETEALDFSIDREEYGIIKPEDIVATIDGYTE